MIITISGPPGSGKNTVADALAKKLNYKHYSMGDIRRKMAQDRGMTIADFNKLGEKEFFTDKEVDGYQTELGKKEDNFIVDGRLSYHFIPNSLKIFLDVTLEVGAKRIFGAKRKGEEFKNLDEAIASVKSRVQSDKARYKKYYNLDYTDKSQYDYVVDTTNLSVDGVVNKILSMIEERKKDGNKKR